MLNAYFEQELGRLRGLAGEFAVDNPALAPLLGPQAISDPDVERVLEGVAFLTSLIRRRLDDEFPEVIQSFSQLLFPHLLRPFPCMTVVQCQPKGPLSGAVRVPAGVEIASVPVDGARAIFRTTCDIPVEPLSLAAVRWDGEGSNRSMLMEFALDGVDAQAWHADRLRLFLGDSFSEATRLLYLLMRFVTEVRVFAPGEPVTVLGADALSMPGLAVDSALVPESAHAHPAFALLREYFCFPEKFLFVELAGLQRWKARGASGKCAVRVVLSACPEWAPALRQTSVLLNAAPAVNLFAADAHPIQASQDLAEYPVHVTANANRGDARIFSIESVTGYAGGQEQAYCPFGAFDAGKRPYHVAFRPSATRNDYDCFISLPLDGEPAAADAASTLPARFGAPSAQTLSVRTLCTQGTLPEGLRLGDVSQPTDSTPARLGFRNISPITPYRPATLDDRLLWNLLSQMTAGHLRMADLQQFKAFLLQQIPAAAGAAADGVRRRIDGIEGMELTVSRRLMRGLPVDGTDLRLRCRSDAFMHAGGLYLFGAVMDEVLAGTTALNTFSALSVEDMTTRGILQWPAKIGRQRLL